MCRPLMASTEIHDLSTTLFDEFRLFSFQSDP